MSHPRQDVLRFQPFSLDLAAHEVRRAGARIHLTQQAFSTLSLLASRAGTIVTREELRRALWPDGTQVEFEGSINFCINQVRSALGDDARAPRYIETVPRVGYRFVAAVERDRVAGGGRLALGSRVAAAAAAVALAATVGSGHRRETRADRPADSVAQDAYLRGTLLMRSPNPGSWEEARASFEQAVARAPRDAAAHVALAASLLALNEAGLRPAHDAMPRVRAAALRALDEDPELAEAWLSLATVRLYYDWDFPAAGRDIERAIALAPDSARAQNALAALLSSRGEHSRAIEAGERAASLDPLCPMIRGDIGWYYYCARRFPEAAASWTRSVAVAGDAGPRDRLVDAFRHLGRIDDAWREARRTMLHAGVPRAQADDLERRGIPAALSGFLGGSARHLQGQGAPPERLAALHAALGEREEALALLHRAARERSRRLLRALAVDPDFDVLRPEPRYRDLLRRVGLS